MNKIVLPVILGLLVLTGAECFRGLVAVNYACGFIAGQDSVLVIDREHDYCVRWRHIAEGVGFRPFDHKESQ